MSKAAKRAGQVQTVLRLPEAVHEQLRTACETQNLSMRAAIEAAVSQWLKDPQVLPAQASAQEARIVADLLAILRSDRKDAIRAVVSNIDVFKRYVDIPRE